MPAISFEIGRFACMGNQSHGVLSSDSSRKLSSHTLRSASRSPPGLEASGRDQAGRDRDDDGDAFIRIGRQEYGQTVAAGGRLVASARPFSTNSKRPAFPTCMARPGLLSGLSMLSMPGGNGTMSLPARLASSDGH